MKKTREKVKFDLSKLDPNFIELALDYFDTEDFKELEKKYGDKESLYFKYEYFNTEYMKSSIHSIEEFMIDIITVPNDRRSLPFLYNQKNIIDSTIDNSYLNVLRSWQLDSEKSGRSYINPSSNSILTIKYAN